MAPEQLAASWQGIAVGDERSDLYSFGIILRELLTGRPPLARPSGPLEEVLRGPACGTPPAAGGAAIEPGRLARVPNRSSVIASSPTLPGAIRLPGSSTRTSSGSWRIVRSSTPPSPRSGNGSRKWTRRHPRLSSSTSVGIVAALLVLALAGTFLLRVRHLARLRVEQEAQQTRLKAVAALHRLRDDLKMIEVLLGSGRPRCRARATRRRDGPGPRGPGRYGVLESPAWQETPLGPRTGRPSRRQQLREDMGELLLLLAGAVARQDQLDLALRLNALAADCFPADTVPRALWRQRAELARSAGHAEEARHFEERAEEAPPHAPRDRYLFLLTEYRQQGRLPEALPLLREASRRQSDNFSVWMILGNCYAELGKPAEAVECYDMAGALWPRGTLALPVPRSGLPGAEATIGRPVPPSTKSSGCGPR